MNLENDRMCFVCGEKNNIGLHLKFETKDRKTTAVFVPKKEHQGYKDIVHGGIIATLLDEAMGRLAHELGMNAVSARITVNLRKPAYVGEKLFLEGEIVKEEGRKVFGKSRITKESGELAADAEGILVKIK